MYHHGSAGIVISVRFEIETRSDEFPKVLMFRPFCDQTRQ